MMQEAVEGTELTEALVLTRTRAPDLESVKKLNCWASQIKDVQVVRRLPNLEVCSLSINRITSLRDFAHCHKLKELYVRTNNIQKLEDIHYLKSLPKLRSLWLSENPCANTPNYRSTVLRSLPNLQKLDNKVVTPEEVETAQVQGDDIPVPEDFSTSSIFSSSLDSTQSSVSSSTEARFISRKKREQRRQKIAAEEAARKSQEDGSCTSSRSEEEHSSCEKSDDPSKSDSDTGWKGGKEDFSPSDNNIILESITSDSKSVEQLEEEDVQDSLSMADNDNGTELQMTISTIQEDDSPVQCDNENIKENKQVVASNEISKEEKPIGQSEENNNNNNKDENDSTDNQISTDANDIPKVSSEQNSGAESENVPSNPLLDKIRLNDSLCTESQDVSDSIALDDLVLELPPELETESIQKAQKNTADTRVSVKYTPKEVDNDSFTHSIQTNSNERKKQEEVKKETENNGDEKKISIVDWDEHNRLRAELGVKPIERTPSKSIQSDVNRIRNANILQAVLSLVKELDKDSLDIVSSTVQSRLEKL